MHILDTEFVTYVTHASGLFCALNFMIWLIKITITIKLFNKIKAKNKTSVPVLPITAAQHAFNAVDCMKTFQ